MSARPVHHVDIADAKALAPDKRRQETVQAVEIRQPQEQIAAERLEAAAGIAGAVAQDGAADRIGDARLQLLESRSPGA